MHTRVDREFWLNILRVSFWLHLCYASRKIQNRLIEDLFIFIQRSKFYSKKYRFKYLKLYDLLEKVSISKFYTYSIFLSIVIAFTANIIVNDNSNSLIYKFNELSKSRIFIEETENTWKILIEHIKNSSESLLILININSMLFILNLLLVIYFVKRKIGGDVEHSIKMMEIMSLGDFSNRIDSKSKDSLLYVMESLRLNICNTTSQLQERNAEILKEINELSISIA